MVSTLRITTTRLPRNGEEAGIYFGVLHLLFDGKVTPVISLSPRSPFVSAVTVTHRWDGRVVKMR